MPTTCATTSLTVQPGNTDGVAHWSSVKLAPSSSSALHSAANAETTGSLATIVTVMVRAYESQRGQVSNWARSSACIFTLSGVLGCGSCTPAEQRPGRTVICASSIS
ncbi:Uncharacterised protein [Mycobacteroides abscessus subsp. abscessus]|nr:Uncharacterised protein [Mycobacteroides abscessus subsp. abscessus]